MIKREEIKQLPLEEIKIRLQDAEDELANLRFQLALRQLDNPLKVRHLRKDVARLKTIIKEYELGLRHEKKPRA
jgi:large subunit ribosomal protein L29